VILYFIGDSLGPSGVATCGETIARSCPANVRLVYLNSDIPRTRVINGSIYFPVFLSHDVDLIAESILKTDWLAQGESFLLPNNSMVAFEVTRHLALKIKAVSANPDSVRIFGIIHSNTRPSIDLTLNNSALLSRIISVSSQIHQEAEKLNLRRIPHSSLLYPLEHQTKLPSFESTGLALRVIYVGRLIEEQKRVSRLGELLDALHETSEIIRFDICGSGERFDDFVRQKLRLSSVGSAVSITLHGRLDNIDVRKLLPNFDVLVLTSDFEGTPLAILEAMSFGVIPLVMYYGEEVREVIEDGVNGIIVDRGDVRAMSSKLSEFAKDKKKLISFRHAAFEASLSRPTPKSWLNELTSRESKRPPNLSDEEAFYNKWKATTKRKIEGLEHNTRIAIWGAGEIGRTLFDLICTQRTSLDIKVLVDKRLFYYMKTYRTVEVVEPAAILKYELDEIIVASQYYKSDIVEQIQLIYAKNQNKPKVTPLLTELVVRAE
jgi:glycosyltransferase involved in cell wall biosynthesis